MKNDNFKQKRDATCDAIGSYSLFLWLRNKTFYSIMELPKINGKRRYKRLSLCTSNFYEAREKITQMAIEVDKRIKDKFRLKQAIKPIMTQKELISARNEAIQEYNEEFQTQNPPALLSKEEKLVVKAPKYLISEVLERMLLKKQNGKDTERRKINRLTKMLNAIGIQMNEDYSKFHTTDTMLKLSDYIHANNQNKNDSKRQWIAHIKELATFGHKLKPDVYKLNIIDVLTDFPKTKKFEQKPHLPYTNEELLEIFNPQYDFFKQNRLKAKDTDFIIPRCQTSGGEYNNKYATRFISTFLKQIGVKKGEKGQKDFHSFRKNASIAMQDAGIGSTYINDIIGWEGKGTMEQCYSNHTLSKIKEQMDKFNYDFLKPEFDQWKEIMAPK